MPLSKYRIVIKNQSGRPQDYSLFSSSQGLNIDAQIFTTVLSSNASYPASQAEFDIDARYYAVVGISRGTPGPGIKTQINSHDVTLGSTCANGNQIPGTTLNFAVSSNGAPSFSHDPSPNDAQLGAFEILTPTSYTQDDAIAVKAARAWVPLPNMKYVIWPQRVFYLSPGKYTVGDIVDAGQTKSVIIDFARYPRGVATVVHDSQGRLVIQK
ncbi:hypothetical protein B0T21DRAFT_413894 [Apiosordaria backusii]|uniref:Uncharacterized protein n=1 Tax=Apiosordaria backusii TaxID=314023 RepID=A0AA40B2S9_9PEZI|nr:hypothetical protein B0T21DRAFT_413894 [Apiosordaria backusii]